MIKRGQYKFFVIAVVLIITVIIIFLFVGNDNSRPITSNTCSIDADCVPSTCCHPSSCIHISQSPNCDESFCTASCEPNTLDCNQGYCSCINNKCEVIIE